MKRNAIVRILLFSAAIMVLLAILVAGLVLGRGNFRVSSAPTDSPAQTVFVTIPPTAPTTSEATQAPSSPEAATSAQSPTASPVTESTVQTVAAPDPIAIVSNTAHYQGNTVRELEIDWLGGSVVIQAGDVESIEISESGSSSHTMKTQVRDGSLSIDFSANDRLAGVLSGTDKDLTVTLPRTFVPEKIEVEATSATVTLVDLTARKVEVDATSGTCLMKNCTVDTLEWDSTSGDLNFSGGLNTLECDSASGNVYATVETVPTSVEIESTSGNLDLTLPKNTGFTLRMDTVSGNVTSDFVTTQYNGRSVSGDGSCRIQAETVSGDVILRQGA